MKRTFLIAVGMMVAAAAAGGAQASQGGGGGGGNSSETHGATPHAFFAGRIPDRVLIASPEPYGRTVLPGGSVMRLDGFKANREVVVATPENGRFRGKHIRTTYNPATGITSVWIRNADGSRTGIHTDEAGNQMVSEHRR